MASASLQNHKFPEYVEEAEEDAVVRKAVIEAMQNRAGECFEDIEGRPMQTIDAMAAVRAQPQERMMDGDEEEGEGEKSTYSECTYFYSNTS